MKIIQLGLLAFTILSAASHSMASDSSGNQWGEWATNPNYISRSLNTDTLVKPETANGSTNYGSGLVGIDENLLHELDQSTLLDYQTQIIEPNIFPEFPSDEAFASGVQGDIEDNIMDQIPEYE